MYMYMYDYWLLNCDRVWENRPRAFRTVWAKSAKQSRDSIVGTLRCNTVSYLALTQVSPLYEAFLSHSNTPAKPTNDISTRSQK